ncbi:MAG TPA: hypothetical protein VGO49_20875 [Bradyrhizobium sp.]|jgi:hypothetical protein|nr:hypothetical protein [Bradyrhizobium sp.]
MEDAIDNNLVTDVVRTATGVLDYAIQVADQRANALGEGLDAAKAARGRIPRASDAPENPSAAIVASANGLKSACDLIRAMPTGGSVGNAVDEWKECRATIDRCDKLLVDMRKTGFGFITAVVAAASYILREADYGTKHSIVWMLVLLINMLYIIDLAHQTWLTVAVTRAKDIEHGSIGFQLTNMISEGFAAYKAEQIGLGLYLVLLFATCAMFLFSIPLRTDAILSGHRTPIYLALVVGILSILAIYNSSKKNNLKKVFGILAAALIIIPIAGNILGWW